MRYWHEILGHCSINDILKFEHVVNGMKITGKTNFNCDTCVLGKMTQFRNRTPDTHALMPLELVHTDLAGPITPVARDGLRYDMLFVDDYSDVIFTYFLQKESDAIRATKRFLADIAPYGNVKQLRSDNGTECTANDFQFLLIQRSAPNSPRQNGTAERV